MQNVIDINAELINYNLYVKIVNQMLQTYTYMNKKF